MTGTKEAPLQELHLDLGAKDENDLSVRFSLGRVRASTPPVPDELKIHGNNYVWMPGKLIVKGVTRPAPIKADYTDPNFVALLVRAWMDGLAAAIDASTDIVLAFADLPAMIRTDEDWSYKVTIDNRTDIPITAARLLETIVVTGIPAPISDDLTLQTTIPTGLHDLATITHQAGQFTQPGELSINVRVTGKRGNLPWRSSTPPHPPIPIVVSPSVDTAGIPNSVPRDQPFALSFAIRNNATVPITLDEVTLSENNTQVAQWLNAGTVVAGASQPFTWPLPPPLHTGITSSLKVGVTAKIKWPDLSTSEIKGGKTIQVRRDADLEIDAPDPLPPSDWMYKLIVANDSAQRLTLTKIHHRIRRENNNAIRNEDVTMPGNLVVDAGEEREITISVPRITENTPEIDLEVSIQYTREDQRSFAADTARRGIEVP